MRIKLYAIGVVLLVMVATVPWVDGLIFKHIYINMLSNASNRAASQSIKLALLEYHVGWLSSDAKIAISFISEQSDPAKSIILEQHIQHGPYVHDISNDQWVTALATLETHMHLPSQIEAMLFDHQPHPNGLLQWSTLVKLGGYYFSQLNTPTLQLTVPVLGITTGWTGLNGTSEYQGDAENFVSLKTHLQVGTLSYKDRLNLLLIKNVAAQYTAMANPNNLPDTSIRLNVGAINFANNHQNISLKNFSINEDFAFRPPNFYGAQLQMLSGEFSSPFLNLQNSTIRVGLENLSSSALTQMQAMLKQKPLNFASMQRLFLTAFVPQSRMNEHIIINKLNGKFLSDGQMTWSHAVTTISDFLKYARAKVNIRISISLINKLIHYQSNATSATAEQPSLTPEQQLLQKIDNLADQKKLDLSVALQLKGVVQVHLPVEAFNRNIDELVLLKQLPADLAPEFKTLYLNSKVEKLINAVHFLGTSKTADESMILDNPKKQQLDALVKQGALLQDQEDYSTTLTYEEGVLKANGIVIDGATVASLFVGL